VPTLLSIKRGAYLEYAATQAEGEGPTPGTQIQRLLPIHTNVGIDRGIDFPILGTT
jgi:hypothetical protein